MAQIEFASVVVVNKCDLISKEALLQVKQTVRALNADATIIEAVNSKIGEKLKHLDIHTCVLVY